MNFAVRRLTANDAEAYRAIRLQALREHPDAFIDSHEEASKRPDDYWATLFDGDGAYFGTFADGKLVGIANYYRRQEDKVAHKSWLYGMHVSAEARGTGCALALVNAVLDHAKRDGVAQTHLGVSANNDRARRLYEKAGFSPYGTEPRGIRIGETFIDEIFMVKFLNDA